MVEKSDHDLLLEVHSTLLGTNGQGGLCRQVDKNTKAINKIWILLAIIIAAGGGGAWGIISKLLGG
jgi:hypothetical protein